MIPALRILVKIKLETPFRKLRVCPLTVYTSELIFCTGSSGNLFYFTQKMQTWNFVILSNSLAKHSHVWQHGNVCIFWKPDGFIFYFVLFQKSFPEKLHYPRPKQIWILMSNLELYILMYKKVPVRQLRAFVVIEKIFASFC